MSKAASSLPSDQLEQLYQGDTIASILCEMNLDDCFIGDDCGMNLPRNTERFFDAAIKHRSHFSILPFNLRQDHWVLCFVIFDKSKETCQMVYFDPLTEVGR